MTDNIIERYLTMAACTAFLILRQHLAEFPGQDTATAVRILQQTNFDKSGLDYAAARFLHNYLKDQIPIEDANISLLKVVSELLKSAKPWWLKLAPHGRKKVRSAMNQNQIQVFREAGLFKSVPEIDEISWWDDISSTVRNSIDREKMLRAREAERMSLQFEKKRLQRLGISLEPEWVSLDDNSLGYDIRSYDRLGDNEVSRLIEVKSTLSDSIYITRNEWNNAISSEQRYYFHVWKFPDLAFDVLKVSAIKPNIPTDNGLGTWQNVRIDIASK